MTEPEQSFSFDGLASRPIPSILRGFSAPVILEHATDSATNAFLLANDTDPFNRWQAGDNLAMDTLLNMIRGDTAPDSVYLDALHTLLRDDTQELAFRALSLGLPNQDELAQALFDQGDTPDPQKIWDALETLKQLRAEAFQDTATRLHAQYQVTDIYQPSAEQSAARSLANAAMSMLNRLDGGALAQAQFDSADNMTQQLAALSALIAVGRGDDAVARFYDQWQADRLVIDKWFSVQIAGARPEEAAQITRALTAHPDFTLKNPNRFRATLGALATSGAGFHHASGAGYELLADKLIALDPVNPQTTARMCTAFETWRRYDRDRQAKIETQLHRILATPDLSRDTTEMITRILG